MQNEKIKALYDKLRLKYSAEKDTKNLRVLWRIEHSLHMLYPYEMIEDTKGKPNYNLKSIVFDTYASDLDIVRKYKRAEFIQSKISAFKLQYDLWVRVDDEKCYKAFDSVTGEIVAGYTFAEEEFVKRWIPQGEALKAQNRFLFNECYRIANSEHARRKRLKQRIERIMDSGQCYFVTLTFNDDTLTSTDAKTRRTYVARFLKSVATDYVGNIDFGKLRGREHYHAVISSDKLADAVYTYDKRYGYMSISAPAFSEWSRLGFYSIKTCGTSETDKKKLASYTAKLVNHAIKETTRRNALLYSR